MMGTQTCRALVILILFWLTSPTAVAQEFVPPDAAGGSQSQGVRLGFYGFGARLGPDFKGDNQVVGSLTLDFGHLFTDRVRLRPSVEVGIGGGVNTYVMNAELMYRFTPDTEIAVPYIGFGLGVWGHQGCDLSPDCPSVWPQFALGFEIRLRRYINWMLEYHAEDALRRHRLFAGLTTRREQ